MLFRSLAYNPVRKEFVLDPRDYKWGSINFYLDHKYTCRVEIVLHEHFLSLGDTFEEQVKEFLVYEDAYRRRLAIL